MAGIDDLPAVRVIIAFFRPDLELARRQVESLLAQQGVKLTGVAVLDGIETERQAGVADLIRKTGFDVVVNETPLGIRGAFAEGLRRALASAVPGSYFCYADQDDDWYPLKLARLVDSARATGAALVHCDARVVRDDGTVVVPSLHRFESRREPEDLLGMILLNSVTGMTSLFPLATARLAHSLMENYQGSFLHDHLTAIAAASLGTVEFLDDVLVDYVQHRSNTLGAKARRNMFRRRAIGRRPFRLYRNTSGALFHDRRAVAELLDRAGRLPRDLQVLFRTSEFRDASWWQIGWTGMRLSWNLFRTGDLRRWVLGLRMMDAALFVPDRDLKDQD